MALNYNSSIASIKYYKEFFVCKYQPEEIIFYANKLLNGELTVGYKNFEVPTYNPDKLSQFNWQMSTKKNANSFSLYLHGLRHIYLLAEAFTNSTDKKYLVLADDFVDSFYEYITKTNELHGMTNNDHAISERIENLIYIFDVTSRADFVLRSLGKLLRLVENDVIKLLGNKYYQRNHNHGIIVDKAALIGLYFLNRVDMEEKINFIIDRLRTQVEYAYHPDGVHKENSLDYHISVTAMLWGCYNALKHINHDYCNVLYECLKNANAFIAYALKPDGFRPLFGDSKGIATFQKQEDGRFKKPLAEVDTFNNDKHLTFIKSRGKQGKQPENLSMLFPCGYAFFREHFSDESFSNATWLSLKAGYITRVHKHKDDLSICLYSKGYDIFVDSGMCGYMPKDKFKDYMESVPAHSTVGIKGISYSIASGNNELFKVQRFTRGSLYDYALASSRIYTGVAIFRHLYYLRKQDTVIIRDEIYSENEQSFAQYFNLSNYVTPLHLSNESVVLRIGDTQYIADIKQLGDVDELNLLEGNETTPFSFVSTGFGTCEKSSTLEYVKKGKNIEFVTVVEIKHEDATSRNFNHVPSRIEIKPDDITVPFEKTRVTNFEGAVVSAKNNVVSIKNVGAKKGNRFTVYVYSSQKEVIKLPYTTEEYIEFEHEGLKDFTVMYFTANKTGEVVKGILGEFCMTQTGFEINKIYAPLHRPIIAEHSCEKKTENKYQFSVDVRYDYQALCSWWVYYNGSCLSFKQNNSYTSEYEFNKAGEYVVMYSFRDKYFGEFVFDQFDKIIIEQEVHDEDLA
jgi:hypothetical protein